VLFDDGQLTAFATTPLVEEEMMFITRADSRFAPARKSISLAKAVQATLILPGLQHGVRPRIENVVRAAGLSIDKVIDINSVAILRSALLADLGATILPVAPVLSEIEHGMMIAYAIRGAAVSRTISLCASKNIPLTNAGAAVARLVLEVAGERCRSGQWLGARSLLR
jgi:LysR family transcriptional regulator, nitrogen assimilation regulatory protein